mmetsp:Transcript_892/g.2452  ORF Transcript_892/g.2452 Transcript_892/m.2452 type:complete len:194 (-) Transcript_892:190-771(-)
MDGCVDAQWRAHGDERAMRSGTIDECNAAVGMAYASLQAEIAAEASAKPDGELVRLCEEIRFVQSAMFDLGAHLATPLSISDPEAVRRTSFPEDATAKLEMWMDRMDETLAPLTTFVLPGGHPAAAALHLARTVCRRGERLLVPLLEAKDIAPHAFSFVNRLSDYFFVLSRYVNAITGVPETTWTSSKNRASG